MLITRRSAFISLFMLLASVSASDSSTNSLLTVTDGIYSRLTVEIQEDVPKHFCSRILNQLEVRAKGKMRHICWPAVLLDYFIHSKEPKCKMSQIHCSTLLHVSDRCKCLCLGQHSWSVFSDTIRPNKAGQKTCLYEVGNLALLYKIKNEIAHLCRCSTICSFI